MGDGGPCHPRDLIAMRYFAAELGLEYDLFGVIAAAREAQARRLADRLVSFDLPVLMTSRAYKPEVPYEDGSSALLVAHYVQAAGQEVRFLGDGGAAGRAARRAPRARRRPRGSRVPGRLGGRRPVAPLRERPAPGRPLRLHAPLTCVSSCATTLSPIGSATSSTSPSPSARSLTARGIEHSIFGNAALAPELAQQLGARAVFRRSPNDGFGRGGPPKELVAYARTSRSFASGLDAVRPGSGDLLFVPMAKAAELTGIARWLRRGGTAPAAVCVNFMIDDFDLRPPPPVPFSAPGAVQGGVRLPRPATAAGQADPHRVH